MYAMVAETCRYPNASLILALSHVGFPVGHIIRLNDPASRSLLLAAVLGGLLAILLYRWSTTERAKVHSFYVEPPKGKWFR
jgi:hypothetical protein